MKKFMLSLAFLLTLTSPLLAQFGKNQVMWEKQNWKFYRSEHFDFYAGVDITDPQAQPYFQELVATLEGSYRFSSTAYKHQLKNRVVVIFTRTHSQFQALRISGQ